MEHLITSISVGEKFPLFQGKVPEVDGAILEALEEGEGYSYQVYLSNMTERERDNISGGKVSIRVITNEEGFVLTLFQFQSNKFIFEAEFDPTLYEDDRALQLTESCNLINIYGIESTDNIVKAMRMASIPEKLAKIWSDNWKIALSNLGYSDAYRQWCNELKNKYSTEQLWDRAVYVGKLGDK